MDPNHPGALHLERQIQTKNINTAGTFIPELVRSVPAERPLIRRAQIGLAQIFNMFTR